MGRRKGHGLSIQRFTRHARLRAAERFPGVDLTEEFKQSKIAVGKKLKNIKRQCPKTCGNVTKSSSVSYFLSHSDIVFVYDWAEGVLITVFPYQKRV